MEYAREKGLFFSLKTNGTLITEAVADRLKELGLVLADVSLYGATAKVHEYVTGEAGSFMKTMRAIELLRERKIRVHIKSTMMNFNHKEEKGIHQIAKRLGALCKADPLVLHKIGQPGTADHFKIDDETLRAFVEERYRFADDGEDEINLENRLICTAGRVRCAISSQGDVFPCALWRIPLGNLREQSFRSIWYGKAAHDIRSIKATDIQPCANCELVGYCIRCPGLASIENGGNSGPSSESCRMARTVKGVTDDRKKETLRKP
jgi:radical SAM protein with 4Fe4S-binding SPASM domain